MKKAKSTYIKLAALCAVMAIVLTQSVSPSLATGPQIDDAFKKLNVKSEAQILDEYAVNLQAFLKKVAELEAKTAVSKAEIDEMTRTADSLKRRSQEVARNVEAILGKLEAAGLRNSLNAFLQAKINDSRARSLLTQGDGITDRLKRAADEIRTGNEFLGALIPIARLQAQEGRPQTGAFVSKDARKFAFFISGTALIARSLAGTATQQDVDRFLVFGDGSVRH
jgi:hypothetical protein